MKSTGIVRRLDDLGRIVLPIEIRKGLGIDAKDSLEIFTRDDTIILRKYEPHCHFCDNVSDIITFRGKKICKECIKELTKTENPSHP